MIDSMGPKILAVRVGRAGDLVMITPALRLLLEAHPAAEVHVLTTAEGRRVLDGFHPRLTRFHLYHRRFPAALGLPARTVEVLRREGYGRVFVFETHPHYHDLVAGIAPDVRAMDGGTGGAHASRATHFAERCLELVEGALDEPRPRGWLTLPVTAAGHAAAAAYLAQGGIADTDHLVGLHLTYAGSAKLAAGDRRGRRHRVWPLASFAELARMLRDDGRARDVSVRPIVDLLPGERELVREFLERAGDAAIVLDGTPDFERYKAVLARLDLLVTPNTGPMHVAAAVGTPVVALFSGWSPSECGPFVPPERYRIVRAEETPHPERGLAAVAPDAVFAACRPFLP